MIDEPFGPDPSVAAPTQEHRLDRRRRAVTNAEVEKALAKITHLEPYFEVGFVVQTNGAKREPPADLLGEAREMWLEGWGAGEEMDDDEDGKKRKRST